MAFHLLAPAKHADAYGPVASAIETIYKTYGDRVSVHDKGKFLNKFGRTENADDGVKTTVAKFQGTVVNETFATTNSVDKFVSTSANDTGVYVVEGHYYDGSNNLIFSSQEVTANGQTPVTLSITLCRANRMYSKLGTFASPSETPEGVLSVYDSTVATTAPSGVPSDATAVKLIYDGAGGRQQTEKCASSVSSTDYFIITEVYASVTRAGPVNAKVDIEVEYRQVGGIFRPLGLELNVDQAVSGYMHDEMNPPLIVPKNSDFRMVATSDTNDTFVAGYVNGWSATIIG